MRLHLILLFCFISVFGFAQRPSNYTALSSSAYDWTQPGAFSGGLGLPTGSGAPHFYPHQWARAGTVYYDSTAFILYGWNGTAWDTINKAAVLGAIVSTNPAGNYNNIQLNRNGLFSAMGLDSLTLNNGALINLGSTYLGGTLASSNSSFRLGSSTNDTRLIQAGPLGWDFANHSGHSAFSSTWTSTYEFIRVDSSVGTGANTNYATYPRRGFSFLRQSIFPGLGSYLTSTFRYATNLDWMWTLADLTTFNPQNSDGIANVRHRIILEKASGYTGPTVVITGTNLSDVTANTLSIVEMKGSSAGNYFHLKSSNGTDGGIANYVSYWLSDNGNADTIDNAYDYVATSGGVLTPHMKKRFGYFWAPGGSSLNADSAWAFYSMKYSAVNHTPRHYFGGPGVFDGMPFATYGMHSGPSHALEIRGTLQFVDSLGVIYPADSTTNAVMVVNKTNGEVHPMSWPAGSSSGVAGLNTQVQYNSSGSFAGSAGFTWLNSSNVLSITGTNSNLSTMPNMRYMYTGDANAALAYTLYTHDNMSINFDSWYDPVNGWTSSHAGSNFAIYKNSNRLYIGVNSGTSAGSTFAGFTDVWGIDATTGNIQHKAGTLAIGSSTANASAKLDVQSTALGFLPPRMTTTQKNAISSPAEGLIVYDLTLHKLCVYTGSAWETVTSL
jgi:hypothetical protein